MGIFGLGKKKKDLSSTSSSLPPMPNLDDVSSSESASKMPPLPDLDLNNPVESSLEQPLEVSSNSSPVPVPSSDSDLASSEVPELPDFDSSMNGAQENTSSSDSSHSFDSSFSSTEDTSSTSQGDEENVSNEDLSLANLDLPDLGDDFLDSSSNLSSSSSVDDEVSLVDSSVQSSSKPFFHSYDSLPVTVGPRFVKVDKYIKMTDVLGIVKQDLDVIVEEGHTLLNVDASKGKSIDVLRADIEQAVKALYRVDEILFED